MTDSLSPGALTPERPSMERRRSRNPLKNIMQHLSVEPPDDDDGREGRRGSLIRRISWKKSRSPSAHSERSSKSAGPVTDPDWCKSCAIWAVDIDTTFQEMDFSFAKAVNPASAGSVFEKTECFLARVRDEDEELTPSNCPLCHLFWAVRGPEERGQDYVVSGFSSRDTNYLIETHKMYEMGHSARGNAPGVSPAFLGVVPKRVPSNGATTPTTNAEIDAEWFRSVGMIYRTLPDIDDQLLSAKPPPSPRHTRERSLSDAGAWMRRGIWGREIEVEADLDVAQDWLRFCEFYHQGRCSSKPQMERREIEGFRLLDFVSNPPKLVETSVKEQYVALSYVWGKRTEDTVPKVVRDAIDVTKAMGYRYLWVDRLCVDDARPEEKMRQISRMDEIFQNAVFTIIAACGEDANHGLSGVGGTPRPPQPKYKFPNSNTTLVSSLPDPRLSIKKSTWYKRGWTYQEALLSRRRLIFTPQQMYWECEGMCCPESLVLPLEFYHDMEERRMCEFMRPGLFNGVSFVDGSWERWKKSQVKVEESSTLSIFREVDQHIVNYSKRELTYDEDSLNAFLGICKRLENAVGKGKIVMLLGIPVWTPTLTSGEEKGPPRTRDVFALSTCFWHHKEGSVATRRRHMPSWTWAGWKGDVELFSSIVVADPEGKIKDRKYHNHHYVAATHVTRQDISAMQWTYSPDIVLLNRDGSVAYDFFPLQGGSNCTAPNMLPIQPYAIHVPNPFVLDKVKARSHAGGWIFNNVSVDVKLSKGPASIREYIERHARGEQMTLLWFIEEAIIMLLVVEKRVLGDGSSVWERAGRMRMGFADEAKDVVKKYGRLEKMVEDLPLRRLGADIIIQ